MGEALDRIEPRIRVGHGRNHMGCDPGNDERVAVRLRIGDLGRPDQAACTAAIFDEEILPQRLAQAFRDDPAEGVRAAAGGKRRDDAHRPCRPVLGRNRNRANGQRAEYCGADQQVFAPHFASAAIPLVH